ncbi:MAG: imidazolonepropionase [Acidobacteriota bacterium]|nr:imidazolonepropionase [Acidobacteriota bacterium]
MIDADLIVTHIAELATPTGNGPRLGADLGQLTTIPDAAVACRDGIFVWVGPRSELEQAVRLTEDGHTVDADGGTALPGFVDPHTHLPFIGWRESEFDERLRGASYSDIAARGGGILSTVAKTREASTEQLAETVENRLDAMLALGTTTVEAKSGYGLSFDHEIKQLEALSHAARHHPVKLVPTFLGAHTIPPEFKDRRADYVALLVDRLLPEIVERQLAEYADAFVDAHAFSIDEARTILTAARESGLGVRLHADQLADDGAAALAAELGASSADHLEYASDAGIEAMAKAGTGGILLPAATFFLMMDAPPPGRRLVDGGVPVALATDFNPGSCPTESMTAAMWFACLNGKLTVDEAITAATLNAAHTLGRADRIGSVEVGKRADLVVHRIPNRYHLVYRFGAPRVEFVFAAGRLVYEA